MDIISAQNIRFAYPDASENALTDIHFSIEQGAFIVLCGPSGSGKSTLLRLIKHDIAPHGKRSGHVIYKGIDMTDHPPLTRSREIGMVFQDPEQQIVMDNVMDELLFGLENFGLSTAEMRKKVAEMVHFFDLNHLLDKPTHELSGGEKQLVNLTSVLLLDPDVLLLDEPTGQLDPIAAREFIQTLERLNDEFGMTIIIAEHRLEELFSMADQTMVLESGKLIHYDTGKQVVGELAAQSKLVPYLPSPARLYLTYHEQTKASAIPLNVKEAKPWLDKYAITKTKPDVEPDTDQDTMLELRAIDFQYNKKDPLVLNNLSLSVAKGEWHGILGANGTGKSTLLKAICGMIKPQHGHFIYQGKKQKHIHPGEIGYLPQDPALFFAQDSLMKEYHTIAKAFEIDNAEDRIDHLLHKFDLEPYADRHPYDLSGGQLQKAALIGALLVNPKLLLIDEPTKGLDPDAKAQLGVLLQSLMCAGLTIIMVTHDVEFAASYATRCSMMFRGQITVTEQTRSFFQENLYYTTVMNRLTRKMDVPTVVTLQEAKQTWHIQNHI